MPRCRSKVWEPRIDIGRTVRLIGSLRPSGIPSTRATAKRWKQKLRKYRCGRKLNSHPRHHPRCRRHLLAHHHHLQSYPRLRAAREPEIHSIKTNTWHPSCLQLWNELASWNQAFCQVRIQIVLLRYKYVILKFSPGENWFYNLPWATWCINSLLTPFYTSTLLSQKQCSTDQPFIDKYELKWCYELLLLIKCDCQLRSSIL